jgi:hypothetical protein
VTVFLGATVKALNAESRLDRERDDDIRAAVAGYESGLVQPALARLVEEVIAVKRPGETVSDAMSRADVNSRFVAAVNASVRSQSPRAWQSALVHRYTRLGACLTVMHVAGPETESGGRAASSSSPSSSTSAGTTPPACTRTSATSHRSNTNRSTLSEQQLRSLERPREPTNPVPVEAGPAQIAVKSIDNSCAQLICCASVTWCLTVARLYSWSFCAP